MAKGTARMKPKGFQNHLTLTEAADAVGRDPSWLRQLERDRRIPKAARVKYGNLKIRLWSPEQIEEIEKILRTHKPGKPKKNG